MTNADLDLSVAGSHDLRERGREGGIAACGKVSRWLRRLQNCVPRLNDVNELLEHVRGGDAKGEHVSLYVAPRVKRFLFMR